MLTSDGCQSKHQTGFTLVELLLVLSLIGLVLAGVFQFFFFTHKSYALADARSEVIQDVNLLFTLLEKDIRSASEPNDDTKAIRILNGGQQIDIYRYNNSTSMYERISYRLNPSDSTQLQRGLVSTATQDTNADPQYGTIPDSGTGAWKTIVSNLLPGSSEIFKDDRNDAVSSRRLIDVSISVKHPKLNESISMNTAIMSRTGKSTTSIVASDNSYVPVQSIKISPASFSTGKGGISKDFIATVEPANATNKNLIWSQQLGSLFWVNFPDYAIRYDDKTGLTDTEIDTNPDLYRDRITSRSGTKVRINIAEYYSWGLPGWFGAPDPRTTTIKVTSPDIPNDPVYLTISQNKNS
jgi:prepilin-type N-terminal cleavage/methylation domain-containing protein